MIKTIKLKIALLYNSDCAIVDAPPNEARKVQDWEKSN